MWKPQRGRRCCVFQTKPKHSYVLFTGKGRECLSLTIKLLIFRSANNQGSIVSFFRLNLIFNQTIVFSVLCISNDLFSCSRARKSWALRAHIRKRSHEIWKASGCYLMKNILDKRIDQILCSGMKRLPIVPKYGRGKWRSRMTKAGERLLVSLMIFIRDKGSLVFI